MCETYSNSLYVPACADNSVVQGSAKFRSKGRLPVLSYYYPPKKVRTRSSRGDEGVLTYISYEECWNSRKMLVKH